MRLADGIRAGEVTVAFRSWKRPTVKAGGTLTIGAIGQMAIDAVTPIEVGDINEADVASTGEAELADILKFVRDEPDRTLYRIDFHYLGEDPRIALRTSSEVSPDEAGELTTKLDAIDKRSAEGPWTRQVLRLIADNPALVSTDLAPQVSMDRVVFKRKVRQLKTLGLTESLSPGYRISPRGQAYLDATN